MALGRVDLCSRALIKIGANPIASFEDGTAEAEVAASLYPPVRDALLSSHPWNFATRQSPLAKLDGDPVADFANAFRLPADCLRAPSAGTNGRGHGLIYKIYQRELHTDADDVVLTYIVRPDEADFPPFFDAALTARLAAEFCLPLTDSASRWEALCAFADAEFRRARRVDSQEDSPPRLEDFGLLEERS